jgi:hypothetical protein
MIFSLTFAAGQRNITVTNDWFRLTFRESQPGAKRRIEYASQKYLGLRWAVDIATGNDAQAFF